MGKYRIELDDGEVALLRQAMAHFCLWVENVASGGEEKSRALLGRLRSMKSVPDVPLAAAASPTLPREVADRLRSWDEDGLYTDMVDRFYQDLCTGRFSGWEGVWVDPETHRVYRSFITLDIQEVELVDDECPIDGEALVSIEGAPEPLCQSCGWTKSGKRRCTVCGVEVAAAGDTVCESCQEDT